MINVYLLFHFIMTCISYYHQNQFSRFLKGESFDKSVNYLSAERQGIFALTLLEINFQIMNERSYNGISFLDMVFIFIFLLGPWK